LPRTTVRHYLERAAAAGLSWPLPPDLDDRALEGRLFGRLAPPPAIVTRPVPDWAVVHAELRRPGVTQALLWSEYRERYPDGFGYTWFTESYHAYTGKLDLVMRQEHRAGEKLFLDFAGQTLPIVDPATGEITAAELFVAVRHRADRARGGHDHSVPAPDQHGLERCLDVMADPPPVRPRHRRRQLPT
jgi:transposase